MMDSLLYKMHNLRFCLPDDDNNNNNNNSNNNNKNNVSKCYCDDFNHVACILKKENLCLIWSYKLWDEHS